MNIGNILSKIMMFLFPWRDALGIMIGGIPMRFGEIWSIAFGIPLLKLKKIYANKWEKGILIFLFINLLLTMLGVLFHYDSIETSFAFKYIIRNILNIVFIAGFLSSGIVFSRTQIDWLFKYSVIIQLAAHIFTIITNKFFYISQLTDLSIFMYTLVRIGDIVFHTVHGTTMEPGFLTTLLPVTLYYFLQVLTDKKTNEKERKKAWKYILIILVLSALTFSTAVYTVTFLTIIAVLHKNIRCKCANRYIIYGIFIITIAFAVILTNERAKEYFVQNVLFKIQTYFHFDSENYTNFSAKTRGQQKRAALNWFLSSSPPEAIFGHGTGGYWQYARSLSNTLDSEVSEAYNIYVSTLTDRGILGLFCILGIFFCVYRLTVMTDRVSKSLFWGIAVQAMHWMLVGNFWLYHFWYHIVFVIGYHRFIFKERKSVLQRYEKTKNHRSWKQYQRQP